MFRSKNKSYLHLRFQHSSCLEEVKSMFPLPRTRKQVGHCMVGFDFGLALQQTSALRVPRRGPSSCGASSASGTVFYFTVNFFHTGVSMLLIKTEIQVFKDAQVSLPSSLTKPWPSCCFKKHVKGLRLHVSCKICWFHKYRKVKHGLSATFTFLQCLQGKEK